MDPNFWASQPLDRVYNVNLYDNFQLGIFSVQNSLIYLSMWNTSNSTFQSEAVGFNLFRGQCLGKWEITVSTALLQEAHNCTAFSDVLESSTRQTVVTGSDLALADYDLPMLAEYLRYPGRTLVMLPMWVAVVNSMVWSRIMSLSGVGDLGFGSEWPELAYSTTDTVTWSVPTLQPKPLLFLVLAIQPLLLTVASFSTFLLYSTPVSEKFGLTALLAGVSEESREVLRGAAFSGQLKRPVSVKIVTGKSSGTAPSNAVSAFDSVEYVLDGKGKGSHKKRGRYYR
jgi:hypothetical protein